MTYDLDLDARIRRLTSRWQGTDSKKMFGGICHLLNGHMFSGVHREYLILRLGEAAAADALKSPRVRPFDITGRPMKGWVMVDPKALGTDEELADWLNQARQFVGSLPKK